MTFTTLTDEQKRELWRLSWFYFEEAKPGVAGNA